MYHIIIENTSGMQMMAVYFVDYDWSGDKGIDSLAFSLAEIKWD